MDVARRPFERLQSLRLAACACAVLAAGCAETTTLWSDGATCSNSACLDWCHDQGFPTGTCSREECLCGGREDGGSTCDAVACNAWCVAVGSDYGECRGDECACTPPVALDADADADGADDGTLRDDAALPDSGGPCTPGDIENVPCGLLCGTLSRTCSAGGTWGVWSDCLGEGECSPGGADSRGCSCGGSETRTCSPLCAWGSWSGCPSGVCSPGATESRPCSCGGSESRTCNASCSWGSWSGCSSGDCSPGATESRPCSCGGSESRTCNASCSWGSWSGCSSGTCSPGARETRDCACGSTTESRTCNSSCSWGSWSGCPVPSHLTTGTNNDPCSEAAETWRCVYDSRVCGGNVSQVCRGGVWVSFHCNPANCENCCPSYSSSCS
jgi:hypothetical protein